MPATTPHRRLKTLLVSAAALCGAAAGPPGADAAVTCSHTADVLEVKMSANRNFAKLSTSGGAIAVRTSVGAVSCAGVAPTTTNINTVLVVDESDDPATPATSDGNTILEVVQPAGFAPGMTAEGSGASEIEFLVDTKSGFDEFWGNAETAHQMIAGDDGVNWNAGLDNDADMVGMPFDGVAMFGGPGADSFSGQGGAGTGAPLSRDLYLYGGGAGDSLYGGSGSDTLNGDEGSDTIRGYEGDDDIELNAGDDLAQGGAGTDTVLFEDAVTGVTFDLANVLAQNTGEGVDTVSEVENVIGSAYSDSLSGDALANLLDGDLGDDTLNGRGGADELRGGAGGDAIVGGAGADTVAAGDGPDAVEVRDGEGDRVACGAGADTALSDRRSLDSVDVDCETVDALPESPQPTGGTGDPTAGGTGDPTTGADTALDFSLRAASRQRVLARRGLRISVRCPAEPCTVSATARATLRGAGSSARVALRLRPARATVAAGTKRTLRLGLTPKARAALARGQRPVFRVTARGRDAAGNAVVRTLRVRSAR